MDRAERLYYIKKIAKALCENGYYEIDLTLRLFGAPTSDQWSGTSYDYVLNMLEKVENSEIKELARSLGLLLESGDDLEAGSHLWTSGWFRLFISHVSVKREFADQIKDALEKYNISVFVAHKDIEPTSEWQSEIELALSTTHALTAILTDDFHESNWTDQEIGFVMGRGRLVVPVQLEKNPYGFIGKYQSLHAHEKTASQIAEQIFIVLTKHKLSSRYMAEALVLGFEQSGSFYEAKNKLNLLEDHLHYSDASIIERILLAPNNNSQIRESFGVVGRVTQLVNKLREL